MWVVGWEVGGKLPLVLEGSLNLFTNPSERHQLATGDPPLAWRVILIGTKLLKRLSFLSVARYLNRTCLRARVGKPMPSASLSQDGAHDMRPYEGDPVQEVDPRDHLQKRRDYTGNTRKAQRNRGRAWMAQKWERKKSNECSNWVLTTPLLTGATRLAVKAGLNVNVIPTKGLNTCMERREVCKAYVIEVLDGPYCAGQEGGRFLAGVALWRRLPLTLERPMVRWSHFGVMFFVYIEKHRH